MLTPEELVGLVRLAATKLTEIDAVRIEEALALQRKQRVRSPAVADNINFWSRHGWIVDGTFVCLAQVDLDRGLDPQALRSQQLSYNVFENVQANLDVEVGDAQGVVLNELAAGLDHVAHQPREDLIGDIRL